MEETGLDELELVVVAFDHVVIWLEDSIDGGLTVRWDLHTERVILEVIFLIYQNHVGFIPNRLRSSKA